MSTFRLLTLAVLFALPSAGEAATWYVATTGSNSNTCTQAKNPATPKLTISAALACLAPHQTTPGAGAGHTVEVGNGVYNEEIVWNTWPSGTSWAAPFTLKATNRGQPEARNVTLKPLTGPCNRLAPGKPCFNMEIGDFTWNMYLIIDGFLLDGTNLDSDNIRYAANYIRVQHTDIDHGGGSCILGGGDHAEFLNMTMRHCSDKDMAYHHNAGHNITYIGGSYNLFQDMTVYDCLHNELTAYNGGGGGPPSSYNVFNRILTNGCGIGLYSGTGNVVSNSLITGNTRSPLWGGGYYDSAGTGVIIAWGCIDCKALNNTIYNNFDICIYVNTSGNTGVVIKNNICWQNGGGIVNDMAGGGGAAISNNLMTDPRFINPTISASFKDPAGTNFRLQVGSPAIDKGADLTSLGVIKDLIGIARPQGNNYDLGAYEFTSPAPSNPTNLHVQ